MLFRHAGAVMPDTTCRIAATFDGERKKQAIFGLASFAEAYWDRIMALVVETAAASSGGISMGDAWGMTPGELRDVHSHLVEWQDEAARQAKKDVG